MEQENLDQRFWKSDYDKMPGHWLLASMGKKVLRPGGLEMTNWMVQNLAIDAQSSVVELAPGVGRTAQIVMARNPFSYTGVERNETAAAITRKAVEGPSRQVCIGNVEATGLESECATVVYGEAFLTMQSQSGKEKIFKEVHRILKPGGLYGIHELCVSTESPDETNQIQKDLSSNIRVNARPIHIQEWRQLIEEAGFEILHTKLLPMSLLEPKRLLEDEGVLGLAKITTNLILHPSAFHRIRQMRKGFRKQKDTLQAMGMVVRKK